MPVIRANRLRDKKFFFVVNLIMRAIRTGDPVFLAIAQEIIEDDAFVTRALSDSLPHELAAARHPRDLPVDTHRLLYRFEQRDMPRLIAALQLPPFIVGERCKMDSWHALCCALTRIAVVDRTSYQARGYLGAGASRARKIAKAVFNFIFARWSHKVLFLDVAYLRTRVREFANATWAAGSVLPNVWGFIDGSFFPTTKPGGHYLNQRAAYSGHKRSHGLAWQGIVTPDGLFAQFAGPYGASMHDSAMYRATRVERALRMLYPFAVYGDAAYGMRPWLMKGFQGRVLTPAQRAFNRDMSRLRISVEWAFGDLKTLFPFTKWRSGNRVRLSPVGQWTIVAAIMTNAYNCLRGGNLVAQFFGVEPPLLEQYFV